MEKHTFTHMEKQQHPFFQSAEYRRIFTDPSTGEIFPQMRGGEIQNIPLHDRLRATHKRRREKGLVIGDECDPVQFKRPRQRTCYRDLPQEVIQLIGDKIDDLRTIECFRATERNAYVNVESAEKRIKRIAQRHAETSKSCWGDHLDYTVIYLIEAILKDVGELMSIDPVIIADEYILSSGGVILECEIKSYLLVTLVEAEGDTNEYDIRLLFDRERVVMDIHQDLGSIVKECHIDRVLVPFLKVLRIVTDTLDLDVCYEVVPDCMKEKLRELG